ncbi:MULTISPECIES: hypothetical protein [Actinoplanes]|uniref:hypothetical protein n=1 Tax=Actinoplanes TaxID=1865 RepID=UPI0005F2B5D5|nr:MULTISPECIES: hypothetical protein [Actinoplanes]GLY00367.1 hypothetical protein Acsp01_07460 [Actinoplanes sp. NBRC 101535]
MSDRPGFTPDRLLRGTSLPNRLAHVLAGLGGLAMASMITLLWATEPAPLPARTRLAFAAMIAIGLAWVVVGSWALRRRPLFAVDRVIAGWLATICCAALTAGSVLLGVSRHSLPAVLAAVLGLVMTAAALTLLVRARSRRDQLRRDLRRRSAEHPG